MGKTYGYVCICPYGQEIENQLATLQDMQVPEKNIFMDRMTDSSDSYPQYHRLLKKIKANDLLYIKNLDTLGMDYAEIGQQWRVLTMEKKADIVVLDMPQLDTRRGKTQFDRLVADLVLVMLEYAPSAEWAARKQRQKEGIAKARQRGVQFGRPSLPLPDNFEQVYRMWQEKKINGEKAAELCHMSKALFYRRTHERRELNEAPWQDKNKIRSHRQEQG